jgi:sterol desaturase/sphingolipid hydroxylase (fatty acid hydroxylase superfamily)
MYFSVLIPHMFVFGHPIHLFFNAQHTALTPAGGHHGFEGPVADDKVPTGSYFHYLHHRYFECNYGESTIPLDKWFGTFRDGLKVGTGTATNGGGGKEPKWVTALTVTTGLAIGLAPLVPFVQAAL